MRWRRHYAYRMYCPESSRSRWSAHGREPRGADSDLDLVVLTEQPSVALCTSDWIAVFGDEVDIVRTADFGAIQERRLRLPTGLVIEVGIAEPSWAASDPLDAGTGRVVRDGIVLCMTRTGC